MLIRQTFISHFFFCDSMKESEVTLYDILKLIQTFFFQSVFRPILRLIVPFYWWSNSYHCYAHSP